MRTSSVTTTDFVTGRDGAGSRRANPASSWRRVLPIPALVAVLLAVLLIGGASPASAAYLHTTVTGEYGKEGPKASGVGNGCNIAYQAAQHRLYLFADEKIYGLNRTAPGTVSPIGGTFPISAGINSFCGDRDLVVDNSGTGSAGNIYAVPSNTNIYGWGPAGLAPLDDRRRRRNLWGRRHQHGGNLGRKLQRPIGQEIQLQRRGTRVALDQHKLLQARDRPHE